MCAMVATRQDEGMNAPAEPDDVTISLRQDEALVLFEWLAAYNRQAGI